MAKRTIKEALGASLRAEGNAVADRFARAESFLEARENPQKAVTPTAPPREKVVRDGFTMPADDYALITQLQCRGLEAGLAVTKSEILRAGLHALDRMTKKELLQILQALHKVKTGRPTTV